MSDDAYLAMLNSNNKFTSKMSANPAHGSNKNSGIESIGNDSKTSWVLPLVTEPNNSNPTRFENFSAFSLNFKKMLLNASQGLSFYSEADFGFEFFHLASNIKDLSDNKSFLEVLETCSPQLPSNLAVSQFTIPAFFGLMDDSDSSETGNTVESFKEVWNKIKSENKLQDTVYYVKDSSSSYNYYFLTFCQSEKSCLFGLVTTEVQTS